MGYPVEEGGDGKEWLRNTLFPPKPKPKQEEVEMKPEDRNNEFHTLRISADNGRALNRGDGGAVLIEGWGGTKKLTALTQEEQLELAVDLDNLEEKLRLACDGDSDRQMLARWVDRLCQ